MTKMVSSRTGDVGVMDTRGYFKIVDRKERHDPGIWLQRLPK